MLDFTAFSKDQSQREIISEARSRDKDGGVTGKEKLEPFEKENH